MILTAAAGYLAKEGLEWLVDLAKDKGEDLVLEGVKKVTGIDLNKSTPPTPQELQKINDYKLEIEKLDFQKLQEQNRHEEHKEEQISNRWFSDNKQGGLNAKIRPYVLIYLMFAITLLALLDGNAGEFEVKAVWSNLFVALALSAFNAYFVLRTYEKHKKVN